ncbi:MAG: S-methyl-5'-thioadenosine phosphorylase [Rubrivivax sp.]|nr:S-methyl-5'-thioadenosine phosphorylase [Rubrivivax sp.]
MTNPATAPHAEGAVPEPTANTSSAAAAGGRLGILGGSGLYELPGLTETRWVRVETPWGAPSDEILLGRLGDAELAFLPRHGRGHRIPPSEVNYRANIAALKSLGVTDILSLSAVGSLRADLPPGSFVIVDQFIDRTSQRAKSFFGSGLVAHVSMAHPVCSRLGEHVARTLAAGDAPWAQGGTYLAMEGPQFSTLAESRLYRSWNCSVIGMTNWPEAALAREAEICYASVSMVTDFDCWHPAHDAVTVDAVIRVLLGNAERARGLVSSLAGHITSDEQGARCACRRALDAALITAPAAREPAMVERLRFIAARVL